MKLRAGILNEGENIRYHNAFTNLFEQEPPSTTRHLREIEWLLSSAYRGFGYHNRYHLYEATPQSDELIYAVDGSHIAQLGGLFLPFFGIPLKDAADPYAPNPDTDSPGKKSPATKQAPTKYRYSSTIEEDFPVMVPEREKTQVFQGTIDEVSSLERTTPFLSQCTIHIPMTIANLFMNLGAFEYEGRFLPCYLNQPDVNNRDVKNEHVYDPAMHGLKNRTAKEFGTIETAWGTAGAQTMTSDKAVISFYEVHTLDGDDGDPLARLNPCLRGIGQGQALAGDPFATRLTLDAATSLCIAFTGKHPSTLYPDDFPATGVAKDKEDELAHRLVCTVLQYIRVRWNSLSTRDDYEDLFYFLGNLISHEMTDPDNKGETEKYFVGHLPLNADAPKDDLVLRKYVWMLMNAITPIRISFLDGQRRAAGTLYALLNRFPEQNAKQLFDSLDPLCAIKKLLQTGRDANFSIVSEWVTIDCVRPNVEQKQAPNNKLGNVELKLLKRHSQLVQQQSNSSREQTFTDGIVRILSAIEKEEDNRMRFTQIGELQMRNQSDDKKMWVPPDSWPKKDFLKNDEVYAEFFNHVVGELFLDPARSLESLTKRYVDALDRPLKGRSKKERRDEFIKVNRERLESKLNKKLSLPIRKGVIPIRSEFNTIAMLCANFVSDIATLNKLVSLVTNNSGNLIPRLCGGEGARTNEDGLIPGKPGDDGKLYGVSLVNLKFFYRNDAMGGVISTDVFCSESWEAVLVCCFGVGFVAEMTPSMASFRFVID